MPMLPNTDTGGVWVGSSYHTNACPTPANLSAAQTLANSVTWMIGQPSRLGGFEAQMLASNPNLRILLYGKSLQYPVNQSNSHPLPEALYQHSNGNAIAANRMLQGSVYLMDPNVTVGSFTVQSKTGTSWASWHKQDALSDTNSQPGYNGYYMDVLTRFAYDTSVVFNLTDATISSGSQTLTCSTNAPFSTGHVGCTATINGAGVAGASLSSTISAYISPTQVTLNTGASTSVTNSTGNVSTKFPSTPATFGAQWNPSANAPYNFTTFHAGWFAFTDEMKAYFNANSKYLETNGAVDGTNYYTYYSGIASHTDSVQAEHWIRTDDNAVSTYRPSTTALTDNLQMALDIQNASTGIHLHTRCSWTDTTAQASYDAVRRYLIAAYMICNRGLATLDILRTDTDSYSEPQNSVYKLQLGSPIDSSFSNSSYKVTGVTPIHGTTSGGTWYRRFANGVVVISASDETTNTITLDRAYTSIDGGAAVSSISLAPGSAFLGTTNPSVIKVLQNASNNIRIRAV